MSEADDALAGQLEAAADGPAPAASAEPDSVSSPADDEGAGAAGRALAAASDTEPRNDIDTAAGAGATSAAAAADPAGGNGASPAEAGRQDDDIDEPDLPDLELEGEIAADYIEGLLDVADLDGDIDMDVEGDRAVVSVVGATLDELVGPRGEVLDALQELTRLAVLRQTGSRTRMMLDIGGYRQRRRVELTELGNDAADEVKRTGIAKTLDAMNAFERKIVHDAIAGAGLQSESEGAEPDRRVVVLPAL